METTIQIEVLSLGKVQLEGAPLIHYPPGSYVVDPAVAGALRDQGVLAPEPPPAVSEPVDTSSSAQDEAAPGRKGKGA